MKVSLSLLTTASLASLTFAHPGAPDPPLSTRALDLHRPRTRAASNCAANAGALKARRLAKRSTELKKRDIPTSVLSAATAKATGLLNTTCTLMSEVTEGPYFLRGDLLRTDVAEDQGGIPLTLDIGLIDINTCEPLANNLIEIWHANATGSYSYFSTATLDAPGGSSGGGGMGGGGAPGNGTMSFGSFGGMSGAAPSGAAPSAGARLAKRYNPADDGTFLRGAYPTNDEGIVEFTSVFPGFYTGRTTHIHMMVRKDYEIADNGTIISTAGQVEHIGQLFFSESWNSLVFNTSAYLNTTQSRTYNDEDSILSQSLSAGDWPYVDASLIGETVEEGIYAYITVGIDTNASYSITTENVLSAADLDPAVQSAAFSANGLLDYLSSATASAAQTASAVVAAASESASSAAGRVRPMKWW
ncbi:hypothetical protein JCM8097_001782 [Rhodosporidiobolus ruineniae]